MSFVIIGPDFIMEAVRNLQRGIFFLGIVLLLFLFNSLLPAYLFYFQAIDWVKTDAIVVSTSIKELCGIDEQFKVVTEYKFSVKGETYYGSSIQHGGDSCIGRSEALQSASAVPAGKHVWVSYDDQNPSLSLLSPARLSPYAILGSVGLMILLVGLFRLGLKLRS